MAGNVHLWAFFGDLGGIFVFFGRYLCKTLRKKDPNWFSILGFHDSPPNSKCAYWPFLGESLAKKCPKMHISVRKMQ